ncbi:MAG: hypothetical protein J7L35_10100 [Anaerolineales bacterium]|nr:hypothetical protein [Anaerolineales bacterium]
MFPTNLDAFKIYQKELHQRAAHQHLVRSLERPYRWADKVYTAVGRMLIIAGQNLMKHTQAAH